MAKHTIQRSHFPAEFEWAVFCLTSIFHPIHIFGTPTEITFLRKCGGAAFSQEGVVRRFENLRT